ncbi:MAG: hypothetical protein RSB76_03430, partial [Clostridia bacterium]
MKGMKMMNSSIKEIFKEAKKNYNIILKTHELLENSYALKIPIHSAGQWLLDNMYIIEQEFERIKDTKKTLRNKKLPIIKTVEGEKYISIFFLAYELIEKNSGYVDYNLILE